MSILAECRNLTKCYKNGVPAVAGLNLTIESGKIIGLLGPNGSGKTTLIKMMNGLLIPTSGEVFIGGYPPGKESKALISYLPERTYLEAKRTVSGLLEYFSDFYDDFDMDRAQSMIDALGIDVTARLKTLSKGTKEKIQLILVMSRRAKLYILDEPIAGVDPAARDYIIRTIISNYDPEASVLICTHLISDIENVLDDVFFIRQGQIVLKASVNDLRAKTGKTVDRYFR
ncbi:MAG: ABC transporter ATP-binding protein, partial [Lachnospiraceae bacterium]|nr:ABC transporter ATP-binding protein [Lachnospiraceae bacterium]